MAFGLGLSFFMNGPVGFFYGALGILIAFALFGILWFAGMLGAGDVKLLMAFSALSGAAGVVGQKPLTFSLDLALLSILVGGALAICILFVTGRMKPFIRKFYRFLLTAVTPGLETEFPVADARLKMPFGISIAVAAVWLWFGNPLTRWGISLWS